MFKSYATTHLEATANNRTLQESINKLFEDSLDFNMSTISTNMTYTQKIEEALQENDGMYSDDVKTIMVESCVQLSSEVYSYLEKIFQEHSGVKSRIASRLVEVEKKNKEIVQKYEPLIKPLDTSKYTYTAYKYTPDGLSIADAIARLNRGVDNILCNGGSPDDVDTIKVSVSSANKDIRGCFNKVKAILLGVPDSLDINRNFYSIAQKMVIDFDTRETKYFSDEVFTLLKNVTDDFNLDEVSAILALIESNLEDVRELKKELDKTGEEYNNCVKTQYVLCKTYLMAHGLLLIMELLTMKLAAIENISIDYGQVVVNAYNNLIKKGTPDVNDPESTFSPRTDISTQLLRLEAGVDIDLF